MSDLQTQDSGIQGAAQDDTVGNEKQKICAGRSSETHQKWKVLETTERPMTFHWQPQ